MYLIVLRLFTSHENYSTLNIFSTNTLYNSKCPIKSFGHSF